MNLDRDGCRISDDVDLQPEEVVAETCAFELFTKPQTVGRKMKRVPEVPPELVDVNSCLSGPSQLQPFMSPNTMNIYLS